MPKKTPNALLKEYRDLLDYLQEKYRFGKHKQDTRGPGWEFNIKIPLTTAEEDKLLGYPEEDDSEGLDQIIYEVFLRFLEDLTRKHSWIAGHTSAGKSGGWLVIKDSIDWDDQLDEMEWYFENDDEESAISILTDLKARAIHLGEIEEEIRQGKKTLWKEVAKEIKKRS